MALLRQQIAAVIEGFVVANAYLQRVRPLRQFVLTGVNHAQFADGVVNRQRGDIVSDLPDGDATQRIAKVGPSSN